MGKSSVDLETVIVDAYVNSGLYDKKIVEAFRRMKEEQVDIVLKSIEEDGTLPYVPPLQGAGMGEPSATKNPIKKTRTTSISTS
jgi:hypothetical protein